MDKDRPQSIPPAVLASSLLPQPQDEPTQRLLTTIEALDRLTGGYCYGTRTRPGEVVGICIEKTNRSSLGTRLLHLLLATHLTGTDSDASKRAQAFYIDGRGNFSPRLLYDLVVKGPPGSSTPESRRQEIEAKASSLLDGVSCMRVLDATGVDEAVLEVQQALLPGTVPAEMTPNKNTSGQDVCNKRSWRELGVVADSQAVRDDLDEDDDEDLLAGLSGVDERQVGESSQDLQVEHKSRPLVLLAYPLSLLSSLVQTKGLAAHNARLVTLLRSLQALTRHPAEACVVVVDSSFDSVATRLVDLQVTLAIDRTRSRGTIAWSARVDKDRRSSRGGRHAQFAD